MGEQNFDGRYGWPWDRIDELEGALRVACQEWEAYMVTHPRQVDDEEQAKYDRCVALSERGQADRGSARVASENLAEQGGSPRSESAADTEAPKPADPRWADPEHDPCTCTADGIALGCELHGHLVEPPPEEQP